MSFFEALQSAGPATDRADKMGLYGWLAGDWTMEGRVHAADGSRHEVQGHIHAGWVLEGRAIQDVWILPGFFYGTTLRVYDPNLDAWHIFWSDPLKQYFARQIGRARGRISSRKAATRPAKRSAGGSPTLRKIRFAGWVSGRWTMARHGSFRRGSWRGGRSCGRLNQCLIMSRSAFPISRRRSGSMTRFCSRWDTGVCTRTRRCWGMGAPSRHCGSTRWRVPCRRMRHPGCIFVSPRRLGRGSMHFIWRRFDRAGGTTGSRGCVSITVRNITPRSWLIPTATGSRRIMAGRRAIAARSVMYFTSRSPRIHYSE